ncbi:MAG: CARDB domain-containing protein, partial [Candidatus Aenigmatarchaeota archaeon]
NPKSPFNLLPDQEKIKTFLKISPLDRATANFKLYVDVNAISNIYDLEFKLYKIGEPDTYLLQKVPIHVQGKPKLIIERTENNPIDIQPGDIVNITTLIKNVGGGAASFLEVKLISNTSYVLPVFSGGSYFVGTINPNEEKEAKFYVNIDKTAEYRTYPTALLVTYKDESGNLYTDSFYLGIPVKGKPVIEILNTKVENSDLKVDIENIGTANAKALKITLMQNGKLIDSTIANELRPSKYKSIRFKGFEYGQATIKISYLDEDNNPFNTEYTINISPSSSSENEKNTDYSFLVPILIIIILIETYYIRKLRKMSKK